MSSRHLSVNGLRDSVAQGRKGQLPAWAQIQAAMQQKFAVPAK